MKKTIVMIVLLFLGVGFLYVGSVQAEATNFASTTIGYGNAIIDKGSPGGTIKNWRVFRFEYTTNPSIYIDQLGATVWTTYNSCDGQVIGASFIQLTDTSMIRQYARSSSSLLDRQDISYTCPPNTTYKRNVHSQHWWQLGNQTGGANNGGLYSINGATSSTSRRSNMFVDVQLSHWAYDYIESMYQLGIMDPLAIKNSCTSTTIYFCPDSYVTRAQMAYFLERGLRGSNYPFGAPAGNVFTDVPASYWNAAVIEKLYADGVTGGCNPYVMQYCPDSSVTRAQMAVFLLKVEHGIYYQPPPVGANTGFSDVPIDHWAAAWIKQLASEGITGGCNPYAAQYCPENYTKRSEMAVFLRRTFAP